MTDNNHPITPPTDLVIDWRLDPGYIECTEKVTMVTMTTGRLQYIATQAARWGADQELEACCECIQSYRNFLLAEDLRDARRPKPPSLKEQALQELDPLKADATTHGLGFNATAIRRALESLPE